MRPFAPLTLSRRNPIDDSALYPWVASVMPMLRERFGEPQTMLGGGMSGQAFEMDGGLVLKVTLSPQEVEAAQRVVALRLEGAELPGLAHFDYGGPVLLGTVKRDGPETAYAIVKERVVPIDAAAVNRSVKVPRVVAKDGYREYDASDLGTPFEFASETAHDWAEATKARRAKLLREYGRWTDVIEDIDGFASVAASMDEFLELTGIPLWDVRPENCGRSTFGKKQIVCYDFEVPRVWAARYQVESRRPK